MSPCPTSASLDVTGRTDTKVRITWVSVDLNKEFIVVGAFAPKLFLWIMKIRIGL